MHFAAAGFQGQSADLPGTSYGQTGRVCRSVVITVESFSSGGTSYQAGCQKSLASEVVVVIQRAVKVK